MRESRRKDASEKLKASTRLGKTGALLFLFVIAFAAALLFLGWDNVIIVAQMISLTDLLILCGFAVMHYIVRALRWHLLVRSAGIESKLGQNIRHVFGGFAMIATPGRLGELVRLRWLNRETDAGFARLVPIAFADRAIELASMLTLIICVLIFSNLGNVVWGLLIIPAVLVFVACKPQILEALLGQIWWLSGHRKPRIFAKVRRILRDLRPFMRVSLFVPLLLIGMLGWLFEGIAFSLLLGWLDVALPVATAVSIFLVAILAGALSGLPGGFGGAEATGVALLMLQSVPAESAVIAIIIIRLTTLWFAILIGLLVFPYAEAVARS